MTLSSHWPKCYDTWNDSTLVISHSSYSSSPGSSPVTLASSSSCIQPGLGSQSYDRKHLILREMIHTKKELITHSMLYWPPFKSSCAFGLSLLLGLHTMLLAESLLKMLEATTKNYPIAAMKRETRSLTKRRANRLIELRSDVYHDPMSKRRTIFPLPPSTLHSPFQSFWHLQN